MSGTENSAGSRLQKRAIQSAISAVLSMLFTLVLLLILSTLFASGKLNAEYEREFIMLCVFIANLVITSVIIRKNREGILITSILSGLFYVLILLIMAISAGSERLLNTEFIRISISAVVGSVLHIALKITSDRKRFRKKRRR